MFPVWYLTDPHTHTHIHTFSIKSIPKCYFLKDKSQLEGSRCLSVDSGFAPQGCGNLIIAATYHLQINYWPADLWWWFLFWCLIPAWPCNMYTDGMCIPMEPFNAAPWNFFSSATWERNLGHVCGNLWLFSIFKNQNYYYKEMATKKYKVTVGTVALQMNELYGTSFMLIESTGLKFS